MDLDIEYHKFTDKNISWGNKFIYKQLGTPPPNIFYKQLGPSSPPPP